MFQPPFKIITPTVSGRDRPSRGYLDDTELLPSVMLWMLRKEEKNWKSANHCWVNPAHNTPWPKGHLTLRRLLEVQGYFILGKEEMRRSTDFNDTTSPSMMMNVPIMLIKGWGFGACGKGLIAHLRVRQVCISKCWFLFLWSQVYKERAKGKREHFPPPENMGSIHSNSISELFTYFVSFKYTEYYPEEIMEVITEIRQEGEMGGRKDGKKKGREEGREGEREERLLSDV